MDIRVRAKLDSGIRYCTYCGRVIDYNEEFWVIWALSDEDAYEKIPLSITYIATLCNECEAVR